MQRNITGCWPIYSDLYRCIRSSHNWMRRFTLFVAELVQQSHTVLGRCRPDSSRLLAPSPVYSFDIWILMLTHPATLRLAICGGFNPLTTNMKWSPIFAENSTAYSSWYAEFRTFKFLRYLYHFQRYAIFFFPFFFNSARLFENIFSLFSLHYLTFVHKEIPFPRA